mmetsp:Transcript_4374/g.14491  ORF Transcript_4374/g.14491 Transcript_4374/m.14491 type:complete len:123 (-) Transcript_4374:122-490(-)
MNENKGPRPASQTSLQSRPVQSVTPAPCFLRTNERRKAPTGTCISLTTRQRVVVPFLSLSVSGDVTEKSLLAPLRRWHRPRPHSPPHPKKGRRPQSTTRRALPPLGRLNNLGGKKKKPTYRI